MSGVEKSGFKTMCWFESMSPGITGLWQVSGRNDLDFDRWLALDLKYIDTWSPMLDLKILLKTVPAVLSGKGAR